MFNASPLGELRFWRGVAALSVAASASVIYVYSRLHAEPDSLVSRSCEPELSESAQTLLMGAAGTELALRQSVALARVPKLPVTGQPDPARSGASAAAAPASAPTAAPASAPTAALRASGAR